MNLTLKICSGFQTPPNVPGSIAENQHYLSAKRMGTAANTCWFHGGKWIATLWFVQKCYPFEAACSGITLHQTTAGLCQLPRFICLERMMINCQTSRLIWKSLGIRPGKHKVYVEFFQHRSSCWAHSVAISFSCWGLCLTWKAFFSPGNHAKRNRSKTVHPDCQQWASYPTVGQRRDGSQERRSFVWWSLAWRPKPMMVPPQLLSCK